MEYGNLQVQLDDTGTQRYYDKATENELTADEASEAYDKWFKEKYPQYKRYLGFLPSIASLQYYYAAYSGMSGWSALIFDEEYLQEWRDRINDFFCKTVVLGGIDCWSSKICARYFKLDAPREGVLYTQVSVTREPRPFAHVEGEKSLPIKTGTTTFTYIYKVTFGISNPKKEDSISYRVELRGPGGGEVIHGPAALGKGQIASALGAEAIVRESSADYTEACLFFDSIRTFEGGSRSSLCNNLVTP
jgi:hypothetical protein